MPQLAMKWHPNIDESHMPCQYRAPRRAQKSAYNRWVRAQTGALGRSLVCFAAAV
jgi:hypothetical protein